MKQFDINYSHLGKGKAYGLLLLGCIAALPQLTISQAAIEPGTSSLSASQSVTLKTTVRRVSVDVVVTDYNGHPLTGLSQSDFKIAEDDIPQSLHGFDVHTGSFDDSYILPTIPPLPSNTFLNIAKAPEAGTPTVILYDALNTSLDDQYYARRELLRFLKYRRLGTPIAIFVLSDKLRLLQGFTEDTDLLSTALVAENGKSRALALHSFKSKPIGSPGAMGVQFDQILADFERMDNKDPSNAAIRPGDVTIDALIQIGRFLAAVPGRKNLVWLSSYFESGLFRSQDPHFSYRFSSATVKKFKQAVDLLSFSHTAIYPVDVKGIRAILGGKTTYGIGENVGRIGMDMIADNTGGHAFYGTNDISEAIGKAIVNGSNYYSLTYEPTNPKLDGGLRHVKVTLDKPGYKLSYRETYFADDLDAVSRSVADAPVNPLTPALERGTPLECELIVEAHLDEAATPIPATPTQMQVLSQYEAMRTKGRPAHGQAAPPVMMQQYLISYGLIARQLEMPVDDAGVRQASLEFGFVAYDQDGRKLNGTDTRIDDTIPEPRYAKLMSDGYHVAQTIALPVTATSIRLAVRDVRGNRTGSLEVRLPLAKVAEAETPKAKTLVK